MTNPRLRRIARRIRESEKVVLHTGPGLLTGTELPAAALTNAVWGSPEGRFSLERFEVAPESLWTDWCKFWEDAPEGPSSAHPQPVHERICELVEREAVSRVITENVFGLLREAGVPSQRIVEFHGRADAARCVHCDRTFDVAPSRSAGNRRCPSCGRTLAPGIVLTGEPPTKPDRLRAWWWADDCDLYVAAGTRFAIHPTDENADHAIDTGADLVVLGERRTALDDVADLHLKTESAGGLSRLRDAVAILG